MAETAKGLDNDVKHDLLQKKKPLSGLVWAVELGQGCARLNASSKVLAGKLLTMRPAQVPGG
jgi:hypothetical protein